MDEDTKIRRTLVERAAHSSAAVFSVVMSVAAIAFTLNLTGALGLPLHTEQYLALILSLALPIVFLTYPRFGKLFWIDGAGALLAFLSAAYVAVRYPSLVNELAYRPLDGLVISALLVGLIVEAVRRVAGLGLTAVVLLFIAYAFIGPFLPFATSRYILPDRLLIYLAMDTNAAIGLPLTVASTVVFLFILLGTAINRCGGGDFFTALAFSIVGRTRGGAAKIALVSSFLFGSVSGSAVANVVASGVVTIPLMRRSGYPPHSAAAIEALVSTGGQLAPPIMGAAAFLMAEFLQIPYSTVVLAALIPTFLYYFALFVLIDLSAAPNRFTPPTDLQIPATYVVLVKGWHFIVPFAVLVVTLFYLNWRPDLSALAGAVSLLVLATIRSYGGRCLRPFDAFRILRDTGFAITEVIVIAAAAGLVIGVLNITGLAFSLTLKLVQLASGGLLVLLVFAAVVSVVLGMGMPTVGVYVLLASLIGPALVQAGINPIAAHIFLLYYGMLSMITPPVALASFTAASLAGADHWRTGWTGLRMGWIAYILPFMIVLEPGFVMQTSLTDAIWLTSTAAVGIVFVTAASIGYLRRPLASWERVGLCVCGLVAVAPLPGHGWHAVTLNLAGLALGLLLVWPRRVMRSVRSISSDDRA